MYLMHCGLISVWFSLIGYDAFSFDITEHMNNQDEQVVRVLVKDPTEKQVRIG